MSLCVKTSTKAKIIDGKVCLQICITHLGVEKTIYLEIPEKDFRSYRCVKGADGAMCCEEIANPD